MSSLDGRLVDFVRRTRADVEDTDPLHKDILPEVDSRALPFFGALTEAHVVTIGMNRAELEFVDRGWEGLHEPEEVAGRLARYFDDPNNPEYEWFRPWERALSTVDVSYHAGRARYRAAHVDLSPRVTVNPSLFALDTAMVNSLRAMLEPFSAGQARSAVAAGRG